MPEAVKFQSDAEDYRLTDMGDEPAEDNQETAERKPLFAHVFCGFAFLMCLFVLTCLAAAIFHF